MAMIKRLLIISLIGLPSVFTSCIDRYYLDEQRSVVSRIVVDAVITDKSSIQTIVLSETSSPEKPQVIGLSRCVVLVIDGDNHQFTFTENLQKPGTYFGTIDTAFMGPNSRFMLSFYTPEGTHYISDYEEITSCPPVDSVYYEIQHLPTSDPEQFEDGIQFYVNLNSSEEKSRYYRWNVTETWEYHSTWPISLYYEGGFKIKSPSDYSKYYCYRTQDVNAIYLLSTENLKKNKYNHFPLQFVDNTTQRLLYKYSILITQYSLSLSAFKYWNTLSKNNQESGGLYATQPSVVEGNVYNADNSDERVLGYFGVSSVKEKRIILKEVPGLPFKIDYCDPYKLEEDLSRWSRSDWPIYVVYMDDPNGGKGKVIGLANPSCFDCTLLGGTTKKPDYWDEK